MDIFQVTAFIISLVFYGAYIIKAFSLKRIGISTNRLAQGVKPKATYRIEFVLKIVTLAMVLVQTVSIFGLVPSFSLTGAVTITGLLFSAVGTAVFITAMRTMRRNWRAGVDSEQSTELVIEGIYKHSRNPAFLGFDLFYLGLGAAFPNIPHIAIMLLAITLFHLQILEEEKFLMDRFKDRYQTYKKNTNRYWGFFRKSKE